MANKQVTLKRVTDAQGNTDNVYPTTEWVQVENKPSTFTPTAHDHTLSDITDAGTVAAIDTNASTTQFLRGDGTWATISDSDTTYTAGTGLSLTGTVFANTAPDQTVALTGSGATTVTGTYPNFTISSTDTNTTYDLSPYAPLASPALTGTPTAPTAANSTNTTQLATTAFVTNKLAGIGGGGLNFEGTIDLSGIGGKNGDDLASAGLTAPGDYLIVSGTGVINNDGSPFVTLAVQAPGDEGDSTIPVTLETGDWIVYVSGSGTTMTVSIINNTDTRFAPTVHTHSQYVAKAGDTMTGSLQINSSGTIGGTTLSNGWLKIGTTLAMDTNEIYFGTTGYIGTTTANDLIFMYLATERARITSEGLDVSGKISNGSIWINNGDEYNNYNENIRLFAAPNGVSVIGFNASGTGGEPVTSILGFSDRLETRVGSTWRTRLYDYRKSKSRWKCGNWWRP